MKSDRICSHCNKVFENIEGRVFSNHVRWCDKNPKNYRDSKIINNMKNKQKEYLNNKLGEKKEFAVICHKCNNEFKVIEREKQFPKKEKYFCSRACANSRIFTDEAKDKKRKALEKDKIKKKCTFCEKEFYTKREEQIFCSILCANKSKIKNNESLEYYRRQCDFHFNPYHYPEEFNIKLLEEHGFYSPSNKNNNINGVSKDHMVSVRYGFDNNIDPKILSHPSNCQLLIHNDNISKHKDCSITYEELLNRIEQWNIKYGGWAC